MDPDGDYESRHSIRSTASDAGANPAASNDDVASPSKIFAPGGDIKPPTKSPTGGDAYKGPTAPTMEEDSPLPTAPSATDAAASPMDPRGNAYADMMRDTKMMGLEPPVSNSVAVPIGFDSDVMALPEATALPIVSSTTDEGLMTPTTLEEVDTNDTEAQIDDVEPTPVPVPFSSNVDGISTTPGATSDRDSDEQSGQDEKVPSPKKYTRKCKLCFVAYCVFVVGIGTVLGVLFGTDRGQLLLNGFPNCIVEHSDYVGNGSCDGGDYNTAECGWDGGDCVLDGYPDCHVDYPYYVGSGRCSGGDYNTAECGWDGGDCVEFNEQYPGCHVYYPSDIGNGDCDGGKYNTAECGWDGGDCLFRKHTSKTCTGTIDSTWTETTRSWCQQKCIDEGDDCKAFDYNFYTEKCRLFSSYSSTTSNSDGNCWVKK